MSSILRKQTSFTITTPLPPNLSASTLLPILHDHTFLFTLGPPMSRYDLVTGDADSAAEYTVTNTLAEGGREVGREVSYGLSMANHLHGLDATAKGETPVGVFEVGSVLRVGRVGAGEGDAGEVDEEGEDKGVAAWEIVDEVKMDGPRVLFWVGLKERTVEKHRVQHEAVISEALRRMSGRGEVEVKEEEDVAQEDGAGEV